MVGVFCALLYLRRAMKKMGPRDLAHRVKRFFSDGRNRIRLLFLGLSLLLWFLIKLSKTGYVSEATFNIDYSELPAGLVFTEEPPGSLQLKLQGSGYSLLKYNWFNFRDLDIDLNSLENNRKGEAFWTSASARNYLEAQINDESTRILDIYPDTIFFSISKLITKSLPIELVYEKAFDTSAYTIYGAIRKEYDSVLVEAPVEVFSKIKSIKTQKVKLKNPADTLVLKVALENPQLPHLTLQKKELELRLEFSPLTEGNLQVPISSLNVPDTVNLELFPSQTEVIFRCALRDYKDIRAEEFRIYVDYREILAQTDSRFLSLNFESPPSQVINMHIQPKRVEYLLSKP